MKTIFPIGVWFDGRVEGINCSPGYINVPYGYDNARKYYEQSFRDIKSIGIDIVVIPNTPPDYREVLLASADITRVKIVLELVEFASDSFGNEFHLRNNQMTMDEKAIEKKVIEIITPLKKHKSLMAYQLIDEPTAETFPRWAMVNKLLAKYDPDHPAFSCLCNEDELPRTSQMGTKMLVFDRYPLRYPQTPADDNFRPFGNLMEKINTHAGELPFWMVLQSFATPNGYRYPTKEELSIMVYQSLLHNAKGIFFFLYNSYTQQENLEGLVGRDYRQLQTYESRFIPTPTYYDVKQLAGELKRLSPLVLSLVPEKEPEIDSGYVEFRTFVHSKTKQKYLMLVNLSSVKSIEMNKVVTDKNLKSLQNVLTGEKIMVDKSGKGSVIHLTLPPGAGYIFKINS
ncbi:MAG: hypothetical protein ACE14V_07270 [bacterium]